MVSVMQRLRSYLRLLQPVVSFRFQRPVVLLHSDDWGLGGIPDKATYARLDQKGLSTWWYPFDKHSLETAQDLQELYAVLGKHYDSRGRSPGIVFNFILANVNFEEVAANGFKKLCLLPVYKGLPTAWQRPDLLEAYRQGIETRLVYPALHGLTHFNLLAAETALAQEGERHSQLVTLYEEGVPQLYSYTPWLGYEFRAGDGVFADPWLTFQQQFQVIAQAIELFEHAFGHKPTSACAPGYRANDDTLRAFARQGVRVVQDGPSIRAAPYYDRYGLLHLPRNVVLEPALDNTPDLLELALQEAESAIARKWPVIVTIHSMNFQSALHSGSSRTLAMLDDFLTTLEQRHADLRYMHDGDLLDLVESSSPRVRGANMEPSMSVLAYWSMQPETQHAIGQRIRRSR
jgi:hypothetical protein